MISDEENNQFVTKDAFELLHLVLAKRLAAGIGRHSRLVWVRSRDGQG